jgi:hypothetical protein
MSTKKRKFIHHKKEIRIPLAIVAGFVPTAWGVYNASKNPAGFAPSVTDYVKAGWLGLDIHNQFHAGLMWNGLFPVLMGFGVHKAADKLGFNRALKNAGIPFISL